MEIGVCVNFRDRSKATTIKQIEIFHFFIGIPYFIIKEHSNDWNPNNIGVYIALALDKAIDFLLEVLQASGTICLIWYLADLAHIQQAPIPTNVGRCWTLIENPEEGYVVATNYGKVETLLQHMQHKVLEKVDNN